MPAANYGLTGGRGALARGKHQPTRKTITRLKVKNRIRIQERRRTAELEELLPLISSGNLMAEDPQSLTGRHLVQIIGLGQAALDYLRELVGQTGAALVSRSRSRQ
jgi:hypothetical protein